MLTVRVIPCLDVRDGRVKKGVRFRSLRDVGDPCALSREYEEQGADELVMLDIGATPDDRSTCIDTVQRIRREVCLPLTVGGGIRSIDDCAALLEAGADKVSMNSAAVRRPELIGEVAQRFGTQCAVVAVDAMRTGPSWSVVTKSGTCVEDLDAIEWIDRVSELGAGEILLTSWDRDGTRSGYDEALLEAAVGVTTRPVIASGGAADVVHLVRAARLGVSGLLAASIFHEGDFKIRDLKASLAQEGVEVRLCL